MKIPLTTRLSWCACTRGSRCGNLVPTNIVIRGNGTARWNACCVIVNFWTSKVSRSSIHIIGIQESQRRIFPAFFWSRYRIWHGVFFQSIRIKVQKFSISNTQLSCRPHSYPHDLDLISTRSIHDYKVLRRIIWVSIECENQTRIWFQRCDSIKNTRNKIKHPIPGLDILFGMRPSTFIDQSDTITIYSAPFKIFVTTKKCP